MEVIFKIPVYSFMNLCSFKVVLNLHSILHLFKTKR